MEIIFMKKLLLVIFSYACTTGTYGQETTKYNELGLIGETNISGNASGQTSLAGIQFKHFGKKNIGYRVFAGYGEAQEYNFSNIYFSAGDTSVEKHSSLTVNMPMVGLGIEGQHPLYKHVYMFAAFELRLGYGSGSIDTSITRHYPDLDPNHGNTYIESGTGNRGPKANMLLVGLAPSVGIKFRFGKIVFGTEFSNLSSYRGSSGTIGSNFDFDLGRINQRLFLNYSF
jgi:hypothetical protein